MANQEERFSVLAQRIVGNDPNPTSSSLQQAILRYTDTEDFNPDQIRRLSEAVNQQMFNRVLNDDTKKFDKTAEFPLVDPNSVIEEFYSSSGSKLLNKAAEEIGGEFDDYYRTPINLVYSKQEKTASEYQRKYSAWENGNDPNKYFTKLSILNKLAEKLNSERNKAKLNILDGVDKLASYLTYPNGIQHSVFEKCAFVLHGEDSMPFLNMLRNQLDMKPINGFSGSLEKVGSVIIDDSIKELKVFETIMDSANNYVKFGRELTEVNNTIEGVKNGGF